MRITCIIEDYDHQIIQANVQFMTTIGQKHVELVNLMILDGFRIPVKIFGYEYKKKNLKTFLARTGTNF